MTVYTGESVSENKGETGCGGKQLALSTTDVYIEKGSRMTGVP